MMRNQFHRVLRTTLLSILIAAPAFALDDGRDSSQASSSQPQRSSRFGQLLDAFLELFMSDPATHPDHSPEAGKTQTSNHRAVNPGLGEPGSIISKGG